MPMTEESRKQLVQSIVNFLRNDSKDNQDKFEVGLVESVDVAVECLEQAYGLQRVGEPTLDLTEIYSKALEQQETTQKHEEPSKEKKDAADEWKSKGNAYMGEEKFQDSVDCYTRAIELNPTDPVYYCNRAAAFSKIDEFRKAIDDCQKALKLQPSYAKAYGRMGLAYSCMQMHEDAIVCYRKAKELEPDNQGFAKNLDTAEKQLANASNPENPFNDMMNTAGLSSFMNPSAGGTSPDLTSLLNNPNLLNMATSLMSNPDMQTMMSSFLGTMTGLPTGTGATSATAPDTAAPGAAATTLAAAPSDTSSTGTTASSTATTTSTASDSADATIPGGLEALFSAGRRLAQQMQSEHPDLINQLRTRNEQPPQP